MASEADGMVSVTCTAPVNIAVIKYWGKRDEQLILPINASLSLTLDQSQLRAKTTVAASASFTYDKMWLNGEEQSVNTPRLQNVLREIRQRAAATNGSSEKLAWKVHICSENNFPTAAGLASSAAGLACLVYSLAKLFDVQGDISEIARQGSGSACRSVYGGFVAWDMGRAQDGSDSLARQVAKETHWPEMRALILVVSAGKKHTASTAGMQTTVNTSSLLQYRAQHVVPMAMDDMTKAILSRDFDAFAQLTMKDSNSMHAVCLDTYPPITYMTDTSRDIHRLVHAINTHYGVSKVCYTYDAGPNACLYLLEDNIPMVLGLVQHFFPAADGDAEFVRGLSTESSTPSQQLLDAIPLQVSPGAVKYIISTKVGPGPQVLESTESLLNATGLPK